MSARDFGALVLLASFWGASFLFMRIATPVLGPFVTVELRVLLAAVALLLFSAVTRYKPVLLKMWKQYLIVGALNAAVPFALICTAELHETASLAAILNATTPLFTALVAWGWVKEPLGGKKIAGLGLGIVGVAVLVGWSPVQAEQGWLMSMLFSLLAALSYGFAGIYSARAFRGVKPMDVAIGQQVGASVLLLPFALFDLPSEMPGADVVFSVLGLALFCTAVAYLLYFRLINNVGPVKTLSVTFLVPIFGMLWGVLFLQETVTLITFVGLILIFLSILLVTKKSSRS